MKKEKLLWPVNVSHVIVFDLHSDLLTNLFLLGLSYYIIIINSSPPCSDISPR